jgi:hypothetical protein
LKTLEQKQQAEILFRVKSLMQWEEKKALLWYQSINPLLGGTTPETLVRLGRGHKVLGFIKGAEDDSHP